MAASGVSDASEVSASSEQVKLASFEAPQKASGASEASGLAEASVSGASGPSASEVSGASKVFSEDSERVTAAASEAPQKVSGASGASGASVVASAGSERVKVACRLRPPARIAPLAWAAANNTVIAARNPDALTPCPSPHPTPGANSPSHPSSSRPSHSSAPAATQKLQPTGALPARALTFEFDRVFGFHSSNFEVYHEFCKAAVERAIAGCRAVVLLYGQTGTGKTHTISGNNIEAGVFHHAMADIFRAGSRADVASRHGDSCQRDDISTFEREDGSAPSDAACHVEAVESSTSTVPLQPAADTSAAVGSATSSSSSGNDGPAASGNTVRSPPLMCFLSVVEIYNEKASDLLQGVTLKSNAAKAKRNTNDSSHTSSSQSSSSTTTGSSGSSTGSAFLYTAGRRPITEHQVHSLEEAAAVFEVAGGRRQVRGTSRNSESSRSHTVYLIRVRRSLPVVPSALVPAVPAAPAAVPMPTAHVRAEPVPADPVPAGPVSADPAPASDGKTFGAVGSIGVEDGCGAVESSDAHLSDRQSGETQSGEGRSSEGRSNGEKGGNGWDTEGHYTEGLYSEGLLYLVDLAGSESCKGEDGSATAGAAAAGGSGSGKDHHEGPWWGGESALVPLLTGIPKGPLVPPLPHRQKQYCEQTKGGSLLEAGGSQQPPQRHRQQQQQLQQRQQQARLAQRQRQQKGGGGQKKVGQGEARRRETESINRSLLALTSVLTHLSQARPGLPPYRRSLLTRLLQPCLGSSFGSGRGSSGGVGSGGNGGGSSGYCTVLFCIDPQDVHVSKTTLRYSAMTRRIRMEYRPSIVSLAAPKHAPAAIHKSANRRAAKGATQSKKSPSSRPLPANQRPSSHSAAPKGGSERVGRERGGRRKEGNAREKGEEAGKGVGGRGKSEGLEEGDEKEEQEEKEEKVDMGEHVSVMVVEQEGGAGGAEKAEEKGSRDQTETGQREQRSPEWDKQQQHQQQQQHWHSQQRGILSKTQQQHVQGQRQQHWHVAHCHDHKEQHMLLLQQQVLQLRQQNQQLQRQRLQLLLLWRRRQRAAGGGVAGVGVLFEQSVLLTAGLDVSDSGSSSGASDCASAATENVAERGEDGGWIGEEEGGEGAAGARNGALEKGAGGRRRRKGWSCNGRHTGEGQRVLQSIVVQGSVLKANVLQGGGSQDLLQERVLEEWGRNMEAGEVGGEPDESGDAVLEWYNGYGDYNDKENAYSEYSSTAQAQGEQRGQGTRSASVAAAAAATISSTFLGSSSAAVTTSSPERGYETLCDSSSMSPDSTSLSPDSGSGNVSPNSSCCSDPLMPTAPISPLAAPISPLASTTSTLSKLSLASKLSLTSVSSTATSATSGTVASSTFSLPLSPPSYSREATSPNGCESINLHSLPTVPPTLHACSPPTVVPRMLLLPSLPFVMAKRRAASFNAAVAASAATCGFDCDDYSRRDPVGPWKCAALVCTAMQCVQLDVQSRGDGEEDEGEEEGKERAVGGEIGLKRKGGVIGCNGVAARGRWVVDGEDGRSVENTLNADVREVRRVTERRAMPVVLQRWLAMACVCFSSQADMEQNTLDV